MPITVENIQGSLKRKYADKNKPKPARSVQEKEAKFKAKHGREPATDAEIDEVYGPGSATRAMGEVYKKMKKNK